MEIDILILEDNPQRFKKAIEFFHVRPFIKDLQAHGIFPKIVTSLDQIEQDTYYLLILTRILQAGILPYSPSIMLMGGSMTDVLQASRDFHFAGICRLIHYRDQVPFIYGHPMVGKAIGVYNSEDEHEVDHGSGEVFALMRPQDMEKKRLIPFLLEYLEMYDQLGLKDRSGPVLQR